MRVATLDRDLRNFRLAYLVLAVLVGALGVAVHFVSHEDYIALGLVVVAAAIVAVGSMIWARMYRNRKMKF